jgi:hypothetical protein
VPSSRRIGPFGPYAGRRGGLAARRTAVVAELPEGQRLDAIGMTAMAETGVPLDRDFRPLIKADHLA